MERSHEIGAGKKFEGFAIKGCGFAQERRQENSPQGKVIALSCCADASDNHSSGIAACDHVRGVKSPGAEYACSFHAFL
jgi:hypothetical protein